jgi:cytochrome c oxidase subunit 2
MLSVVVSNLPPTTATWTSLFNWYLTSGVIAGGFVIGLLLFFALRYRARGSASVSYKRRPESPWIVLAVVVIMASALFAAGYQTFASASNIEIPKTSNSVTIRVLAYQWGWNFTYPNGGFSLNNLTVPANQVVILNVTSRDVFHSFGIPFLDVKEDAIPGKVNQLWFEVPQPGVYKNAIRCFELCGVGHAFMMANLTVVDQTAWAGFLNSAGK